MRSSKDILKTIEENRDAITRYGVCELALFGSGARDEANEDSDLDFLVAFEKKSFDAYMDLRDFLERLFACRVDLVLKDALKPRLRDRILREALHASGL